MDEEIQRALTLGYSPTEIAMELQRRGIAVPPFLLQMPKASTPPVQRQPSDMTNVAVPVAVGAGVGLAASGLEGLGNIANAARPSRAALRRVAKAIEQSGGVDALRTRLQDFKETGRGDLVTLGDLSVPLGEQVTDYAATRHEPTRATLVPLNEERRRGVPGRLTQDVRELVPGGYSSAGQMGELAQQSQRDFAAGPLGFQGLRDMNPTIPAEQARKLAAFIQSPRLQKLWEEAAAVGGIGPKPSASALSFEVLQDLKERMDDATDVAFRSGRGNLGDRLRTARDQLVSMLRESVPEYEEVAKQYADFSQHRAALEDGVAAWRDGTLQLPDLQRKMQDLNDVQRNAFKRGMVSAYLQDIENAKTNRNFANEMMNRSAVLEKKLEIVFGSESAFKEAVRRFGVEAAMSRLGGYIGGSQTARRGATATADLGEMAVEAAAHPAYNPFLTTARKIPEYWANKVAAEVDPFATARGLEAIEGLLARFARLPK